MVEDVYIIEDKYIKTFSCVQFACSLRAFKTKNRVKKGKTAEKKGKGRQ